MIITFFERFVASKTVGVYIPAGTITFDDKPVDNTNSFDETKGSFEAPIEGTYVFFVNAYVGITSDIHPTSGIRVNVNDYENGKWKKVMEFPDDEDAGKRRQLTFFFEVFLKKQDKLSVGNDFSETIYLSRLHSITFLGYLM